MLPLFSRPSQRLSVALFASALVWAACGSETRSVSVPDTSAGAVVPGAGVAAADIGSFVERGRAVLEAELQVWRSQGVPEWAVAQRLEAAESFFTEVTEEGWTPSRIETAARCLAVFRAATDCAVADGKITQGRGETLVIHTGTTCAMDSRGSVRLRFLPVP